jgi:hypothetical protein
MRCVCVRGDIRGCCCLEAASHRSQTHPHTTNTKIPPPPSPFNHYHPHDKQTITRAGGEKAAEDYTPEDVIVDAHLEYTGPGFMDDLRRLVRDATKGAGSVEEVVGEGG